MRVHTYRNDKKRKQKYIHVAHAKIKCFGSAVAKMKTSTNKTGYYISTFFSSKSQYDDVCQEEDSNVVTRARRKKRTSVDKERLDKNKYRKKSNSKEVLKPLIFPLEDFEMFASKWYQDLCLSYTLKIKPLATVDQMKEGWVLKNKQMKSLIMTNDLIKDEYLQEVKSSDLVVNCPIRKILPYENVKVEKSLMNINQKEMDQQISNNLVRNYLSNNDLIKNNNLQKVTYSDSVVNCSDLKFLPCEDAKVEKSLLNIKENQPFLNNQQIKSTHISNNLVSNASLQKVDSSDSALNSPIQKFLYCEDVKTQKIIKRRKSLLDVNQSRISSPRRRHSFSLSVNGFNCKENDVKIGDEREERFHATKQSVNENVLMTENTASMLRHKNSNLLMNVKVKSSPLKSKTNLTISKDQKLENKDNKRKTKLRNKNNNFEETSENMPKNKDYYFDIKNEDVITTLKSEIKIENTEANNDDITFKNEDKRLIAGMKNEVNDFIIKNENDFKLYDKDLIALRNIENNFIRKNEDITYTKVNKDGCNPKQLNTESKLKIEDDTLLIKHEETTLLIKNEDNTVLMKNEDILETKVWEPPGSRKPLWIPPKSPHNLIEESLYNNPWGLLVATIFLNKTSCEKAYPYIREFLRDYTTPHDVLKVKPSELERYFVNIGLVKRSVQVWRMSHDFLYKKWKDVGELHGIGKYGRDAFEMFCLGNMDVEPNDRFLRIYKAWFKMFEDKHA